MPSKPRPHFIETPMTYEDVAKLLHVDKKTLRRMIDSGDWPAPFRIGKQLRWLPSTVRSYLAALEMVERVKKPRTSADDSGTTEDSAQKPARRKANGTYDSGHANAK